EIKTPGNVLRNLSALVAQLVQRSGSAAKRHYCNAVSRLGELFTVTHQRITPACNLARCGDRDGGLHAGMAHRLDGTVPRFKLLKLRDDSVEAHRQDRRELFQAKCQTGIDIVLA